jgi:ACS family hexuronate transporter-like MFS transporter
VTDRASRYRWFILAVFVLSTSINMLDRQMLANLAPVVQAEFGLSDTQYGLIQTAFAIPYALVAPLAGWWIDRIGLTRATSLAVGLWSFAGIATAFTRGLGSMLGCRALLGAAEAAGIPAAGKAIVTYAKPEERAMGHAINQAAVSLGMTIAAPLATFFLLGWGWRHAFIVTGVLGLLWIPLWRLVGGSPMPAGAPTGVAPYVDRRLWAFGAANSLNALPYHLWFAWTTKYFVTVFGLTTAHANAYAWIPPIGALAGGFICGWASLKLVRGGLPTATARYRACLGAAVVALASAAVPMATSPALATVAISLGLGAAAGFSVNLYALPLDVFGEGRAAFAISFLVATYGGAQALFALLIGWTRDHYGYVPVTTAAAITPLLACAILRAVRTDR